jgi:hypothetical protein
MWFEPDCNPLRVDSPHEFRKFFERPIREVAMAEQEQMLSALLSVLEPWQFDDRSLTFENAPGESPRRHMLFGIRPIPREKDEKPRTTCSAGSTLLNIPDIYEEAPFRIGNRLADRVVLGNRMNRIHAVS